MKTDKHLFTSESVTEGHPDKLCDQISDAILDSILAQDRFGRVACEAMVTTGTVIVAGEITTKCYVEIPEIVRRVVKDIGYTDAAFGFDYLTCGILTQIQKQSPDIAMGVDKGGAGDQGMMFGYATDLRSMSQGRANYSMEFNRYAVVPSNVSNEIISRAQQH